MYRRARMRRAWRDVDRSGAWIDRLWMDHAEFTSVQEESALVAGGLFAVEQTLERFVHLVALWFIAADAGFDPRDQR